jgi:hypothetical protein
MSSKVEYSHSDRNKWNLKFFQCLSLVLFAICVRLWLSSTATSDNDCDVTRCSQTSVSTVLQPLSTNTPYSLWLLSEHERLESTWLVDERAITEKQIQNVKKTMENYGEEFINQCGYSESWQEVCCSSDRIVAFSVVYYMRCDKTNHSFRQHLNEHTPAIFHNKSDPANSIDCFDSSVFTIDFSSAEHLRRESRQRAHRSLKECGFVKLKNFFQPEMLSRVLSDFESFKRSPQSSDFLYPCQGKARVEYMLPFQPPFNTSQVYQDRRLHQLLLDFLQSRFKLELQTIITSPAGSGDQRWHQGFRFLFHNEERLPAYAVVVGVPLVDVSLAMGPTQVCPRKKLRFYQGYVCDKFVPVTTNLG